MDKSFKDDVINLRKKGLTYREIRRKIGCTLSVISYHCRRHGIAHSNIFLAPNAEEKYQMQKMYDDGYRIYEIAKSVRRSRHTISKYISKNRSPVSKSKGVINWRRRTKQKLIEFLGGSCSKCGYNRSTAALEFHHLDPDKKDFTIAGKSWSFEKLKEEVSKCVLVCSNCHREIHAGVA